MTNDTRSIELKDTTSLTGAQTQSGYALEVYDDYFGPLWVAGEEFGASWIIRTQSWESAYKIWTDERPTIGAAEVAEAYGFYDILKWEQAQADAHDGVAEFPDLIEGYTYQSNSSGTGIVATGHYEWLRELTPQEIRDTGLRLEITADE